MHFLLVVELRVNYLRRGYALVVDNRTRIIFLVRQYRTLPSGKVDLLFFLGPPDGAATF